MMQSKSVQKRSPYAGKFQKGLPYTSINYIIFAAGIGLIILGYIFLGIGPWNSVWSLTIAPILLGLGYIIALPVAILYQEKKSNNSSSKK